MFLLLRETRDPLLECYMVFFCPESFSSILANFVFTISTFPRVNISFVNRAFLVRLERFLLFLICRSRFSEVEGCKPARPESVMASSCL